MIRCKQCLESIPECRNTICCCQCELKETCEGTCSEIDNYDDGQCPDAVDIPDEQTALAVMMKSEAVKKILQQTAEITTKKKELEEANDKVREQWKGMMERYGVKKIDNDIVSITYVEETTKNSIDTTKLKKELPDVAEKYTKTTSVKAYVKIEGKKK